MTENLFSLATLDPTPCAIPALHGIANAPTISNKATETAAAPTRPETESTPTPTNKATETPETLDSNNVPGPTLAQALATSTASSINLPFIPPAASATDAEAMLPGDKISANPTPPDTLVIPNTQPSVLVTTAEPVLPGDSEKQDDDVVMENPQSTNSSPVSEPCLPQNDDDLPPWLTHNIEYL